MEDTLARINEIAAHQRELGVWEKFETPEDRHFQASMEPPPAMKQSPFYFTTNMEYGRFQLQNRGFPNRTDMPQGGTEGQQVVGEGDCAAGAAPADGPEAARGSHPATAAGSQRGDTAAAGEAGQEEEQCYDPRTDPKYLAASRRGDRPAEDTRGRLTTGYAGRWMSTGPNRFWENLQEVAPLAGYEVKGHGGETTQG